jgi:hypothetical protein
MGRGEGDEGDAGTEGGLSGGEGRHGARRAAVGGIEARGDVENVEHGKRS